MTHDIARKLSFCLLGAFLAIGFAGCSGLYYDYLEKVGTPKREVLVNRVSKARDDQQDAKEQFASALDQFRALVSVNAGDLERTYDRLSGELERCEDRAAQVRDRINSIESVSKALFNEWEDELDTYTSADLRRRSESQLADTRGQYDRLMRAMRRAESSMDPVLAAFRDQVLFLKHNLNAEAIASLEGEVGTLQGEVASLIEAMNASILEADQFISQMSGGKES